MSEKTNQTFKNVAVFKIPNSSEFLKAPQKEMHINLRNNHSFVPGIVSQKDPSFDFNFSSVKDVKLSSCGVSVQSHLLRKINFADLRVLENLSVDRDDNFFSGELLNDGFPNFSDLQSRKSFDVNSIMTSKKVSMKDCGTKSVAMSDIVFKSEIKRRKSSKNNKIYKLNQRALHITNAVRKSNYAFSGAKGSKEEAEQLERRILNMKNILHYGSSKSLNEPSLKDSFIGSTRSYERAFKNGNSFSENFRLDWSGLNTDNIIHNNMKHEIIQAIEMVLIQRITNKTSPQTEKNISKFLNDNLNIPSIENKHQKPNHQFKKIKILSTPMKRRNPITYSQFFNSSAKLINQSNRKMIKKLEADAQRSSDKKKSDHSTYQSTKKFSAFGETSTLLNSLSMEKETPFLDYCKTVSQNSKLERKQMSLYNLQMKKTIKEIVDLVENDSNKAYSITQILFYYQMEMSFRACKLINLSVSFKFKLICFSMSAFTDLRRAFNSFEGLGDLNTLRKILKDPLNKKPLIDIYEMTTDEFQIDKFFFERTNTNISFEKKRSMCRFFKNFLILVISLLDKMKVFINFKTNEQVYPENSRWTRYKKLLRSLKPGQGKSPSLVIDDSLWCMGVTQLIQEIDLRDIQIYIALNKTVIKKNGYKDVAFRRRDNNKVEKLVVSYDEHFELFCPKSKRKDELTKFLFKYIKKQIFTSYKEDCLMKNNKMVHKNIVLGFDTKYLKKGQAKKIFYSENINKKNLNLLREKNSKINSLMNDYVQNSLISDIIHKFYKEESPSIFCNSVDFEKFSELFLHNCKKHMLLFKDCVIALDSLNEVFEFK